MAIVEHPLYPRFPDAIVPDSAHSPDWDTQRSSAPGSDARKRRQSRPYWTSDLSGCECNEAQKLQLIALQFRQKGVLPVLMRVSIFCEIGVILSGGRSDNPVVKPEYQITVPGGVQNFQLRKRLLLDGYENENIYYDVTKPHIDYPKRYGIGVISTGPIEYDPMPELKLYLGNAQTPISRNLWSVDKDTGVITTFGVNGDIYASGGFYIPMLLPPKGIKMSPKGSLYVIKSGIALEEPRGGR